MEKIKSTFEEREITEDKEIMSQIKTSEHNIKKGEIKELKY